MEIFANTSFPFFEKEIQLKRNKPKIRRAATASGNKRKARLLESENTEQEWLAGPGSYDVPALIGIDRVVSGFENSPKYSFCHKYCDKLLLIPRKLRESMPSTHSPGVGTYTPKREAIFTRSPTVAMTREKRELFNFSSCYHIVHAPLQHLHKYKKKFAKGGAIGNEKRFQKLKLCPGPGDYTMKEGASNLFTRSHQSFSQSQPRHPLSGVNRSQGPAAYTPITQPKYKKAFSFSRSTRSIFQKPSPGPCEYSILDTGKYKFRTPQTQTFNKDSRQIRFVKLVNYPKAFAVHPSSRRHFHKTKQY